MVLGLVDGLIWLSVPGFVSGTSYDFARRVLPQRGWGVVFLVCGLLAGVALVERLPDRWRLAAAVTGVSGYGAAAATIGLSIAVLTFQGSTAALTGAVKWWLPFFVSLRVMAAHALVRDLEGVDGNGDGGGQ